VLESDPELNVISANRAVDILHLISEAAGAVALVSKRSRHFA
jgi:hypothetical protein